MHLHRVIRAALWSTVLLLVLSAPVAGLPTRAAGGSALGAAAERPAGPSLLFIENVGQFAPAARFHVRGALGGSVWLAEDALWLTLVDRPEPGRTVTLRTGALSADAAADPRRGVQIRLSFPGATVPQLIPSDRLPTRVSYFLGSDPAAWQADVPVWETVRYAGLYPGVDLELTSEAGRWSWRLTCRDGCPSAPAAARLHIEGAESVSLRDGCLWLETALKTAVLPLPVPVPAGGESTVGVSRSGPTSFDVVLPLMGNPASSPTTRPAPRDTPSALVYGTFLGGSDWDYIQALSLDAAGNSIIGGKTVSSDFPTTPGAFDPSYSGSDDGFVAKLAADGGSLLFSTYLGSAGQDEVTELTSGAGGAVLVTGFTHSADFPVTPGAFDTSHNGSSDGFLVRLSADGTALLAGTYLGGMDYDAPSGLAPDHLGNLAISGTTTSSDFPVTPGAFDTSFGGAGDAFICRIAADLGSLLFCTFVGGVGDDHSFELTVDNSANVYSTGSTRSPEFPTTPGAFDTGYNGSNDGYLFELSADGAAMIAGTFFGGSLDDAGWSLALDSDGEVVVTGLTASPDFPVTPGAYDTTFDGEDYDAYLLRLSAGGTWLRWSTFLGGTDFEVGCSAVLDALGNAVVSGRTVSADFPTTPWAFDTTYGGGYDGFVAQLGESGSALLYSTFVGGSNTEDGSTLAAHATGSDLVLAGDTWSADFPVTPDAYDPVFSGVRDGFVVRLRLGPDLTPSQKTAAPYARPGGGLDYTIVLNNAGGLAGQAAVHDELPFYTSYVPGTAFASSGVITATASAVSWSGVVTSLVPVTLTFQVEVGTGAANGGTLTNQAVISDALLLDPVTVTALTVIDGVSPTGSITIAGGLDYTPSPTVSLALPAADGGSGVALVQLQNDDDLWGSWQTYVPDIDWTLSLGDGPHSVGVRFEDAVGNVSALYSDTISLDTTPPQGSVLIGGGAPIAISREVTLTLDAQDIVSGPDAMQLGNDGLIWSGWEGYATSRAWTLTEGDGLKTVYVRFRDVAGNVSVPALDEIVLNQGGTLPAGTLSVNGGALTTTASDVELELEATDTVAVSLSGDGLAYGAWLPFTSPMAWALDAGDGLRAVYARFQDAAGLVSEAVSDTIGVDTTVPDFYSLSVDLGVLYTNQVTVTLAAGALPLTAEMIVSNDGGFFGAQWQPYSAYQGWTITEYGDYVIPRTVYCKFRDVAGNVSATYQDDIILDPEPPEGGLAIGGTPGSAAGAVAGLDELPVLLVLYATDAVSGVDGMQVSNEPDLHDAAWEGFSAAKAWVLDERGTVYVRYRDRAGNLSMVYQAGLHRIYLPLALKDE